MIKEDKGKNILAKAIGNYALGCFIVVYGGFFNYVMDNKLLKLVTLGIIVDQAAKRLQKSDILFNEYHSQKIKN